MKKIGGFKIDRPNFVVIEDPRELNELSKDHRYQEVLRKWCSRLVEKLVCRPEGFSEGVALIPNREYKLYMPHAVIDT